MRAFERKERMGHGTARRIAQELGVSETVVSEILLVRRPRLTPKGKRMERKVQVAIARAIGVPVDEAFGSDALAVASARLKREWKEEGQR